MTFNFVVVLRSFTVENLDRQKFNDILIIFGRNVFDPRWIILWVFICMFNDLYKDRLYL